mmetsp:Transcript_8260/g.21764  ORF Transcript_8260/g.21764 Transcript_8260/m.21764 type:complete len:82 (-) Transcript_8260:65-310(-)
MSSICESCIAINARQGSRQRMSEFDRYKAEASIIQATNVPPNYNRSAWHQICLIHTAFKPVACRAFCVPLAASVNSSRSAS